jgi:hypothetical protein
LAPTGEVRGVDFGMSCEYNMAELGGVVLKRRKEGKL